MSDNLPATDLRAALETVADGGVLSAEEAEAAFDAFMAGAVSEVQMSALLMGLRTRGAQAAEITGGVRALRKAMVQITSDDPDALVDTAGTGGGTLTTFNISTAAALVAAGAGVPVAKHGNRSFTSKSGSADVLEALGVAIDMSPEQMAEVLSEAGIVFMFAPLLHPAMRHVGPVRRQLGIGTVMNVLGPLTNPASARRQVVGVADPGLLELIPDALQSLGHIRALVVHGEPGVDEVSPIAKTQVVELRDGSLDRYEIDVAGLGLDPADPADLAGGEPDDNARVIEEVFAGAAGGARTAVVMNAAAALIVGGRADSWEEGVAGAGEALDSGAAASALDRLRAATGGGGTLRP